MSSNKKVFLLISVTILLIIISGYFYKYNNMNIFSLLRKALFGSEIITPREKEAGDKLEKPYKDLAGKLGLTFDEVLFLDKSFKENGKMGSNGDFSGGMLETDKVASISAEKNPDGDFFITLVDRGGLWDFSVVINYKTGKWEGANIGTVLPQPF